MSTMTGRELLRHLTDQMMSGKTTDHSYYDVIGTCFDVCEALYWLDPNAVPDAWQYSPGYTDPGPSVNDVRCLSYGLYAFIDQESEAAMTILLTLDVPLTGTVKRWGSGWDVVGWQTPEDSAAAQNAEDALVYAGTILSRYADMIRPAGE